MKNILFSTKQLGLILLIVIMLLGLGLRLFQLDTVPYGSLIDESHFGYLAYSLLETGQDEHRFSWPMVFKGFGDYKLPIYTYVLLPFVEFLDLSVLSIRLPSALAGTISIALMYFLILGLFPRRKIWALLGAMIVAVSPWTFILSRFGFESNLALMWWLVALNGLVRLPKHWSWGALTMVTAGLTWYTYIAYRPVTLVLILTTLAWYLIKKQISIKLTSLLLVVFVAVITPMMIWGGNSNTARATQIGLLADPGLVMQINEQRSFCAEKLPTWWCYSFYNKGSGIVLGVGNRWLNTISSPFLFTQGEQSEKYLTLANYGQFATGLAPLFYLGLVFLFVGYRPLNGFSRFFIIAGLLIAGLPALFAGDAQKVRLSPLLPFLVMTIVIGGMVGWELIQIFCRRLPHSQAMLLKLGVLVIIGLIGMFNILSFFTSFFAVEMAKESLSYQSHVRRLMEYLSPAYHQGAQIFMNPMFSDPVMFFAFFSKLDPSVYQSTVKLAELEPSGFQHALGVERFQITETSFSEIACHALGLNQPTLYVSRSPLPMQIKPIFIAESDNSVHEMAYVYDALAYAEINMPECR